MSIRRCSNKAEEAAAAQGGRRVQVDGTVAEAAFVNDERHGPWVVRKADGIVGEVTFVNGKRQ